MGEVKTITPIPVIVLVQEPLGHYRSSYEPCWDRPQMGNRQTAGFTPKHERFNQPTATSLLHDQQEVTLPLKVVGSAPNTHDQAGSHLNNTTQSGLTRLVVIAASSTYSSQDPLRRCPNGFADLNLKRQSNDLKPKISKNH